MKSTGIAESDRSKAATVPERFSAQELAEILKMSRQAIQKKAVAESWEYQASSGRGGHRKLFLLDGLPADIRRRILLRFGEVPEDLVNCIHPDASAESRSKCTMQWDAAKEWQRELARARLAVLRAMDEFRSEAEMARRAAMDRFCELFKTCEAPGVDPEIYDRVKTISTNRLYEWEADFRRENIAGLISNNGWAKGKTFIPHDQQEWIKSAIVKAPHLRASKIARELEKKFNGHTADRRQVAKFLRELRQSDPALFCYLENPDEYKSKYQLALGDASQKAEHFLHYIEVDSTPFDVLCKDGTRWTIIGGIDIFSRKWRGQLCKTSNRWGIAALLRRIILDWGLPENLIRDNGQDYASRMINESLSMLDVNVIVAPPFTPEKKPFVERVFRTFLHDDVECYPGYTGHNVAERKAIRSRESFAERFGKGDRNCIETALTPVELQERMDRWTEQEYHQREHGTLKCSPNAKAASVPHRPRRIEDPRAIDILLAPAGDRQVRKKGIQYENGYYWADELIDYRGRTVLIRQDMHDAGRLFCFDMDSKKYICEALDMAISGITVAEKIAARKRADKRVRERAKALRTMANEYGDPFAQELNKAQEGTIHNLPVGDPVEGNPFVDAAIAAASSASATVQDSPTNDTIDRDNVAVTTRDTPPVSPEPPRLFPDQEPVSAPDPKVVPFQRPCQQQVEDLYFENPREKFDYYRFVQRRRRLTDDEVRGLLILIKDWIDHADMFADQWPEVDRRWLGSIAPDHFPQYTQEEIR